MPVQQMVARAISNYNDIRAHQWLHWSLLVHMSGNSVLPMSSSTIVTAQLEWVGFNVVPLRSLKEPFPLSMREYSNSEVP